MFLKKHWGPCLAGFCGGVINGLLGAGGGMVLVPLLALLPGLTDDEIFPSSVAIILPICVVTLVLTLSNTSFAYLGALPYLTGSFIGGILSWRLSKKIPIKWLHRLLGVFILWGGVRYLC
jgi:uncharacterized membrane protein YfcA